MDCPYIGKTCFDLTEAEKKVLQQRAKILRMVWEEQTPPDPVDQLIIKLAKVVGK